MIFERWDVALSLFPFVERDRAKLRPIVVLSQAWFHREHDVVVAAMITTAAGGRWPSDLDIIDLSSAGLRRACVVRWKLFTLATSLLARRVGAIGDADRPQLAASLSRLLPLSDRPDQAALADPA